MCSFPDGYGIIDNIYNVFFYAKWDYILSLHPLQVLRKAVSYRLLRCSICFQYSNASRCLTLAKKSNLGANLPKLVWVGLRNTPDCVLPREVISFSTAYLHMLDANWSVLLIQSSPFSKSMDKQILKLACLIYSNCKTIK